MSRVDQWSVTVSVDEELLGVFDKAPGGGVDSEEQKYRPGNMGQEVSLGGKSTTENITVSRLYVHERDHELFRTLSTRVGKAKMVVKKQPLDIDGNPFGSPHVYRGILKMVSPPEPDSEGNDAALFSLEMTTSGSIG